MVLLPLKCTCIPLLLHVLLNLSPSPSMYGTTMEMFLLLLFAVGSPVVIVMVGLVIPGNWSMVDVVFGYKFLL